MYDWTGAVITRKRADRRLPVAAAAGRADEHPGMANYPS